MIFMNSKFFHNLNQQTLAEPRTYLLNLYTGAVPTDAEVKSWISNNQFGYDVKAMTDSFAADGKVRQGYCEYLTDFQPVRNNIGLNINVASRPEEFTVLDTQTVGFFVLACANSSGFTVDTFNTGIAKILSIGSVGDIGSGKDMELPTGQLSLTTIYKSDDLVFNFG